MCDSGKTEKRLIRILEKEGYISSFQYKKPMKYLIPLIWILLICMGWFFLYASYEAPNTEIQQQNKDTTSSNSGNVTCVDHPRIQFFMYHYIRDDDIRDNSITQSLSIPPAIFDVQMQYVEKLAEGGSVTLMKGDDFLTALDTKCFPGENIWIFTDDDWWSDAYSNLARIAEKHHIPFFFGIITNRIDTPGFVTSNEIRSLADNPLFTISSHSLTHSDEAKMSEAEEHTEICESKKILEQLIQKPVTTYIYPSGRVNASGSMNNLKDCWYKLAWSTNFGKKFNLDDSDFSEINRIRITRDTPLEKFDSFLKD